ncbi:MAG: nucleotidyl transferase AbiEii/AbiGii toxin family protein [Actinobacteria bacterium]|nr:nucleotidyl transferase AbiEii/AbiGii toxin family protein [Actinomycetota bacterium]
MRVTEGHLARHYQGRHGGRGPALLDIAQDHALAHLHDRGVFAAGLVFKGGTSLRKFRAGGAGRFSTDLDFHSPDDDVTVALMSALADVVVDGFRFRIPDLGGDGRRAALEVDTPFGRPDVAARIEVSQRALLLAPEHLAFVPQPVHDRYDVTLPVTPVIALEEAIAEKLARFRRVSLARDLYDLAWFAHHQFDEALVRRMWVIKVYLDVVDDRRGNRPLVADEVLRERAPSEFVPEDIGYLTQPVDIPGWLTTVRRRFDFLRHLDADEQQWATCNPGHRYEVDSTGMAPFLGS